MHPILLTSALPILSITTLVLAGAHARTRRRATELERLREAVRLEARRAHPH
ncbi:MAG TPA: hypothetical protein VF212_14635 [Longimicrobiales bacterium]